MDCCDVLIVGGGPAGSTCARRLHADGLDVVVLDKQRFPRNKTCAGWVTPPVMALLQIDRDTYRHDRVLQPIRGFRTGLIGGEEITTSYPEIVSYGIRRCEFDDYLLRRCGARLVLGEPLDSLGRDGADWIVNERIRTPLVVGAGGHFCPVGRMFGNRKGPHRSVVAAQEVEFEAQATQLAAGTVAADVPELFFCDDLSGYGWCFRKGNFLNIGLGRLDKRQLSRQVEAFCDFLRDRGKVHCEIPKRFHGHAYQLYEGTPPKLFDEAVLLIGDAAGLAYPQSGEGIRPAVESGLMAAEVILAASGDYRTENLTPYGKRIRDRFGTPRSGSVTDRLPAGWLHALATRLLATKWFVRHIVLDRWFLHRHDRNLLTSSAT